MYFALFRHVALVLKVGEGGGADSSKKNIDKQTFLLRSPIHILRWTDIISKLTVPFCVLMTEYSPTKARQILCFLSKMC